MKKPIILFLGVMLLLNLAGCQSAANTNASAAVNAVTVEIMTAKTQAISQSLAYKATLDASEMAVVSSKASGEVKEILFTNGDLVKAGDPLIKINDQDYRFQLEQAQNQLAASQSQFQMAQNQAEVAKLGLNTIQTNYGRMQELFAAGAISQADYENSQTAFKKAELDLKSALDGVTAAQVGMQNAKTTIAILNDAIANTVIKAPISGMVDEKMVVLGQFVSPQAGVLAKVKVTDPIYAIIQVAQDDITELAQGQTAEVQYNGQSYAGTVQSIDASASMESRTFNVKIAVPNAKQELKPGIFAEVLLKTGTPQNAIVIPLKALVVSGDNFAVFLLKDGLAHKVPVSTGLIDGDAVEIVAGVAVGDQIILSNLSTIQDGYQVVVKDATAGEGD